MKQKLVKHENDYAFIIDQSILDALNITPDTELELIVYKDHLMIRSIRKEIIDKTAEKRADHIRNIAKEIAQEYSDVFDKLSKT